MSAKTKLDVWNIDYIKGDDMEILAKDSNGEIIEFEEVLDEDLWEDGLLDSEQVKEKIYQEVIRQGEWKLIRRKND